MKPEMPTFLTPAANDVVMKAIRHAKNKGHSQVQPLHVAATLLLQAVPGTLLHNACLDSRKNSATSQECDTLNVCFRVALGRLPATVDRPPDQPPMSNALVAALKRAQANQRRGTLEQSLQPILAVQVEIDQLIISILDDPSVSRVFREAGFSSTAVKTQMEEAVAQSSLSCTFEGSALTRRSHVSMPTFSTHDNPAFRGSVFTTSSPNGSMEAYNSHSLAMLPDRARISSLVDGHSDRQPSFRGSLPRAEVDAGNAFSMSPRFRDLTPGLQQQKRREQVHIGPSQTHLLDTSFHPGQDGPIEYIKRIFDILTGTSKKRNPVLVSDSDLNSVSSSVTKEFTNRLMRGDVPSSLRGVQIIDLPVTSLSVGFLSREDIVQKLSKLRSEVDGCKPGGAIISVGDLQWFVETPQSGVQSHSQLVVQELQQMIASHDTHPIWLLASATQETFLRCQVDLSSSLENQLGLEAVVVTSHGSSPAFHTRHARSPPPNISSENPLFTRLYGKQHTTVRSSGIDMEFCPDCYENFVQECALVKKEEQNRAFNSGLASSSAGMEPGFNGLPSKSQFHMSWVTDQKDGKRSPLLVKEEQTVAADRLKDLHQKWRQKCASHKGFSGRTITPGSSGSVRDASTSPVSEVVTSQDPLSRHPHQMLSMTMSNWVPEPLKSVRAHDLAPHTARIPKGNNSTSFVRSSGRDPVAIGAKLGNESRTPVGWTSREDARASNVTFKLKMLASTANQVGCFKTELALGPQSMPSFQQHCRDLREVGQHPLPDGGNWQELSNAERPSSAKIMTDSAPFRRNLESLNNLCTGITQAVNWQKEAAAAVADIVAKCRSGRSEKRGGNSMSTWLMLLGPDRVGKREVAKSLSKHLLNCPEQLIVVSGWSGSGVRGKTPVDRLAEAVSRQPFAVVLLEDVDRADAVVRRSLTRAMECGMLANSNGKEVNFSNVVAIMTCSAGANILEEVNVKNSSGKPTMGFDEDRLLGLCPRGVKLCIDSPSVENVVRKGEVLSVVLERAVELKPVLENDDIPEKGLLLFGSEIVKRKSSSSARDDASSSSLSVPAKRCKQTGSSASSPRAFALDLNLSAEQNSPREGDGPCVSEEVCQSSEPETMEQMVMRMIDYARAEVSKDLFAQLDAAIVFKPFDLDGLTDSVLDKLERSLKGVINPASGIHVEVDKNLLELMVSYAWQTFSHQQDFQRWVDGVVMKAVQGVLNDFPSSAPPNSVMRLTLVARDLTNSEIADNSCSSRVGGVELLLPGEIQVGQ